MPTSSRRKKPKKNPVKVGEHPDMITAGQGYDFSDVIADWKDCSVGDLKKAAADGTLTDEDLSDIEAWHDQAVADGDIDALVEAGIPAKLAWEIANGLQAELVTTNEEAHERWREEFMKPFRERAGDQADWEVGENNGDGMERWADHFQQSLAHSIEDADLRQAARSVCDAADEYPDEMLDEALKDPAMYKIEKRSGHQRVSGQVWSAEIGEIEVIIGFGSKHEKETLNELINLWNRLDDDDIKQMQKDLENNDPYINIHGRSDSLRDSAFRKAMDKLLDGDELYASCSKYSDDWMVACVDVASLEAYITDNPVDSDEAPKGPDPETDDIVYAFTGGQDTVAGPDNKGWYVAELTPPELRAEGATLGHCIGTERHGHPEMLRNKETRVFSLRAPQSGKPKFTIEVARHNGDVREVKGKANRLPGFEAGKSEMTKPGEVRAVVEFLMWLWGPEGAIPRQASTRKRDIESVRDLKGGIKAMEEAGVDPFAPPPKKPKKNPSRERGTREGPYPISKRVAKLVNAAFNEPLGGVWGTG